jgi:hypothetical protein
MSPKIRGREREDDLAGTSVPLNIGCWLGGLLEGDFRFINLNFDIKRLDQGLLEMLYGILIFIILEKIGV